MSASIDRIDFVSAMGRVAREILGEPTEEDKSKRELRYGSRGSLAISLAKGTWIDHETGQGGGVLDLVKDRRHLDKAGAIAWLQERGHITKPSKPGGKRIVATYDYVDAGGDLLFQVVRYDPKDFRQRRPDGNGGWQWKTTDTRVLYRLPAVMEAVTAGRTIFVAEGEKAVHAIESIGLVGTCSPGGAGKWRSEYGQSLAGADVVILPDNDPQAMSPTGAPRTHPDGRPVLPGQDHAADVASRLYGVAGRVRILMLPGLPLKGDVADWIGDGGTREVLEALAASASPLNGPRSIAAWLASVSPSSDAAAGTGAVVDHPPAVAKPATDKSWTDYLQRDEQGEAINNLANAMTALRNAPELRRCFRFDEMLQVAILVCPLPTRDSGILPRRDSGILPRPVRDADVSITQEWLQRHELRRLGKEIVHQAVTLRAEENAFHPVRDYLNGLRWDRNPRLSRWLTHYVGCEPAENLSEDEKALQREYISAIGRMFLISMVARVMRPGCKVDYMLILESIQGEGKSTIGEILAGQWFSDSLPNIGSDAVRVSQHLRGKWLIEIGELSAMSKAETEDLKAFITRKEEQFTPKYGRLEVTEPRQCVFMGTTNRSTYLRDETGARRYWPARAGTIDTIALLEERDQLFAEAVVAYRAGEQWWPDREFEKKYIQPQQDDRRETDAWEQTIGDWLALPVVDDEQVSGTSQRTTCTISQVAEYALRLETGRLGTADQRRITTILECLGWERGKRTEHARPWVRRPKAQKPSTED